MDARRNDYSREQLLDRLVKTVREANALELEDLAYGLSVAIAEERLRLVVDDDDLIPEETPQTYSGKVIPFPVR